MKARLTLAVVLEVGYAVITRTWLRSQADGVVALEILTTAFRLVSIVTLWMLFHELIRSRRPWPGASRHPLFLVAVAAILLVPVLVGRWELPDLSTKIVFGLTSVIVAVREEFAYRGVLQNLLESRAGWMGAIVVSNTLFSVYHYGAYGAPPFTFGGMLDYFLGGCILALVYSGSGSLAAAVALHAAEDALWSFTPLLTEPWSPLWGTALQLVGGTLLWSWVWGRGRERSGSNRRICPPAFGRG